MRSVAVAGVAVLACALAGCAGPSRIEPGTCGNAVLEPGEDCDTFVDPTLGGGTACLDCRYVCDTAEDSCPVGWGCSLDEICRFSSGRYASAGLIDDQATFVQVADVNGDDHADLVGIGTLGGWLRRGGPDLRFSERAGISALPVFGRPGFYDVTGDGQLDAAVPLLSAFFLIAGSKRGFDVIAQATVEPQPPFADGLALFPVMTDPGEPFHDVVALFANGDISALAMVTNDLLPQSFHLFDPYRVPADLRGQATGNVDPGPQSGEDLALTFAGDPNVFIFRTGRSGTTRYLEAGAVIPIPEPVGDGLDIALADVDLDGALDLLVPMGTGVGVALGDGAGSFSPVAEDPRFTDLGWPLAIGDLDADGVLDYVYAEVIYLDRGGVLVGRPTSLGTGIGHARIADFNGDDVNDVAIALRDLARVHIILGSEVGSFSVISTYDFDTPAVALRTGDFDGDRLADVAFVEPSPDGDTVSVGFGAAMNGYPPAALMGRFETVVGIEPAQLAVAGLAFDTTSDLLVMSSPTGAVGELLGVYIAFGAASRQMATAFNLAASTRAIFVGPFSPGGGAEADVVAITTPNINTTIPELAGSTMQLIHGRGDGRFHDSDRALFHSPTIEAGMFDPLSERALWTSGDVDGDGRMDMVGLSRDDATLLLISLGGTDEAPVAVETLVALGDRTNPTSLTLGDVDGDGAPDLVVTWAEGLAVYWNDGGTFEGARAALLPVFSAETAWRGAALVNADGDPAAEVAMVSASGVLIAEVLDRALSLGPDAVAGGGDGIWVGDLDGDHLDDLIVARGEQTELLLAVPHDE